MGQAECLEFLEERGSWISGKEIRDALNLSETSVNSALRKLYRSGDIFVKRTTGNTGRQIKIYKIRE